MGWFALVRGSLKVTKIEPFECLLAFHSNYVPILHRFYPRDAMLARVLALIRGRTSGLHCSLQVAILRCIMQYTQYS